MSPTMSDTSRSSIKVWQPWFDTTDNEDEMRHSPSYQRCSDGGGGVGGDRVNDLMTGGDPQRLGACPRTVATGLHCDSMRLSLPPPSYSSAVFSTRCDRLPRVCRDSDDDEGPLDMSIGRRTSQASSASTRTDHSNAELPGVCDPAIDEHFRRSLGHHYNALFNKPPCPQSPSPHPPPASPAGAVGSLPSRSDNGPSDDAGDDDSSTEMSVDDHFAKALGDTWLKLKDTRSEKKPSDELQLAR